MDRGPHVLEGRDGTPCPGRFLLSNRASACLSRVQFKIPRVHRVGTASITLDNRSGVAHQSTALRMPEPRMHAIQSSSRRFRLTGNARQLERVVLVNQFPHAIIAADVPLCTRAWVLYR